MKVIHLKSLLAFLLIFSANSCNKKYEFPDITQEGKGTFGCIIDGKKYVPEKQRIPFGREVISTRLDWLSRTDYHYLVIAISNDKTNTFGFFKIAYHGVLEDLKEGTYKVTDPEIAGGGFSAENIAVIFI